MRVAALCVLGLFLYLSPANATTKVLRFTTPVPPSTVDQVGVLSDGVPLTSAPMPTSAVGTTGVYELPTHVLFGSSTTIVLFVNGVTSEESNARNFGGCEWDRVGATPGSPPDGTVSLTDWGQYRIEYGTGTAHPGEAASFGAAFGRTDCVSSP